MEINFSDADISAFLKALIELGGANVVDESPDKYIRLKTEGQPVTLTVEGRQVPLAIYGTKSTDSIIINPFAEGDADSARSQWFYSSRNIILSLTITKLIQHLIQAGIDGGAVKKPAAPVKGKAKAVMTEEADLQTKEIAFISKYVLDIDEKTLKEFKSISKDPHNFFNIHYNKTTRKGEVKCLIFSEAQRRGFPSVRQKTWEVLEGIMTNILGTSDLATFDFTPTVIGVPAFESFANILVNVYEHIGEALKLIDRYEDTSSLRSHLKYIAHYYPKARWCTSPSVAAGNVVPGVPTPWPAQVPGMVPMPTMGVPIPHTGYTGVPMPNVPMPMPMAMPAMTPYPQAMTSIPMGASPITNSLTGIPDARTAPPAIGMPSTTNPFVRS